MSSRHPLFFTCMLIGGVAGHVPAAFAAEPALGHTPAPRGAAGPNADGDRQISVYVVLEGPPVVESLPRGEPVSSAAARLAGRARLAVLKDQHARARARLEAEGATVVADLYRVANAIQVRVPERTLPRLRALDGVSGVEKVTPLRPAMADAVALTGTALAWQSASGLDGSGMRIGIIDTGIDYLHADFGGAGSVSEYTANDRNVIEPGSFPTARVTAGFDLAGDDYDSSGLHGSPIPVPDPDPLDCSGHGTNVAGTAAGGGAMLDGTAFTGPYNASLDPAGFAVYPGVAPAAELVAIKVFGCGDGETELLVAALDLAVDPDQDGDVSDRLDVVNSSVGSEFETFTLFGLEVNAIKNLTAAGSLVVASAGNSGWYHHAYFAVNSPSTTPEALSVAATLKKPLALPFSGITVTAPASVAGVYSVGETEKGPWLADVTPVSAEVVLGDPPLGCEPFLNADAVAGKIVLVDRGVCYSSEKAKNAAAAGAVAILIANNEDTLTPSSMVTGDFDILTLTLLRKDGDALKAALPVQVTLAPQVAKDIVVGPDFVTEYSSRGPSALASLLKPELGAPGDEVVTAAAGTGFGSTVNWGTSSAAPIVAGAAALVRQAQPALGPLEVKEILMSTAAPVETPQDELVPTSLTGAGRVAVDTAVAARGSARVDGAPGEVAVSFGVLLSTGKIDAAKEIIVTNRGDTPVTYTTSLRESNPVPGVTVSVAPAQITVPAGGTAKVSLAIASRGPLPEYAPNELTPSEVYLEGGGSWIYRPRVTLNEVNGLVQLEAQGTASLVVPYHAIVRGAGELSAGTPTGCLPSLPDKPITVPIAGTSNTNNPVVTAFELGANDPVDPNIDPRSDLVAIGAATNRATAEAKGTPEDTLVYFGIAVSGEWTTPARGYLSEVGIHVDVDKDGTADYLVTAEALWVWGPESWAVVPNDAPFARVTNLATGERSETWLPVNIELPPYANGTFLGERTRFDTQPYYNSVLVLPVRLADLGIDPKGEPVSFRYAGVSPASRVPGLPPVDQTEWVEWSPFQPGLDTAAGGYEGQPFFPLDEIPAVTATGAGDLLLLYHPNVRGKRHEILELASGSLLPGSDGCVADPEPEETGDETEDGDGNPPEAAGCACRTASGAGPRPGDAAAVFLALVTVCAGAARRRRRAA